MQNNNTAPPNSSQYLSPEENNGGRARSNSVRSQRSQLSAENSDFTRRPSIRIKRAPSYLPSPDAGQNSGNGSNIVEGQHVGRNRALSAPQQLQHPPPVQEVNPPRLSFVIEEPNSPSSPIPGRDPDSILPASQESDGRPRLPGFVRTRTTPRRLRRARPNIAGVGEELSQGDDEYDSNLVDLLDLVGMWEFWTVLVFNADPF
jgi:hypothetical protein